MTKTKVHQKERHENASLGRPALDTFKYLKLPGRLFFFLRFFSFFWTLLHPEQVAKVVECNFHHVHVLPRWRNCDFGNVSLALKLPECTIGQVSAC